MKPRANRSDLRVVKYSSSPLPYENTPTGHLSKSQANEGKLPNKKRMAELALNGKLSLKQIESAMMKGLLTIMAFKKAFWVLYYADNSDPMMIQAFKNYGHYLY